MTSLKLAVDDGPGAEVVVVGERRLAEVREVARRLAGHQLHQRRRPFLQLGIDVGLSASMPRAVSMLYSQKQSGLGRSRHLAIEHRREIDAVERAVRAAAGRSAHRAWAADRWCCARTLRAARLRNLRGPFDEAGDEHAAFVDLAFHAAMRDAERGVGRRAVVAAVEEQRVLAQALSRRDAFAAGRWRGPWR